MEELSVPLCRPSISPEDIDEVVSVLRSGWLAHGEYNHRFEEAFAAFIGVPHAISMNSCTSALEIALEVSGIRGEVICPSFTWVATANAVVNVGAKPVFCEVEPATRNVTAALIEERLTPRTEAVIPVHFAGQPCPMDDIVTLCRKRGLLLIEDSAETLGATWNQRQAGSFGLSCFSFFPTKNITTGEGGMLTCREDAFAQAARARIAHGILSSTYAREKQERPWLRAAAAAGHNFRMPNPLAALGWMQLKRIKELNRKRKDLARVYDEALKSIPGLRPPVVAAGATHVYQMYTLRVEAAIRDRVVRYLRSRKIGASVHFDPPVHLQPAYCGGEWRHGALPQTESLAREIITLPLFPDMTAAEQERVILCLQAAMASGDCQ